jgi:leucine dehydrogenase
MALRALPGEGYARVLQGHEVDRGLQAMMAIHDTTSGPASGGWRMGPYATRQAALRDALRLARGMPDQSAVAATGCGGGKAMVLGDAECTTQRRTCEAYSQ